MLTDKFESHGESSQNINWNMVSVFPYDYDEVTEVKETEETYETEMAKHKPVRYYMMNTGVVEEKNAFFERPDQGMKIHLKPLFVRGKVENLGVNTILVDGGAVVNLMMRFMIRRIGIFDTGIKPHYMVLSNYEGKVSHTLGVI